jgi:hypothetical protein
MIRGENKYQTFELKQYPKINFVGGTMDRTTYKGCFLEVKGQFTAKDKNHNLIMRKVIHELKMSIDKSLDKDFFRDKFITHEDVSDSYVNTGSSYTKLEFTLYPKRQTCKEELTYHLNQICDKIYNEIFDDNMYMKFDKLQFKNRK